MAVNWSILELMISTFGSESMKYCSSKVVLKAKLQDQMFFHSIRQRDFDSVSISGPGMVKVTIPGPELIYRDHDYLYYTFLMKTPNAFFVQIMKYPQRLFCFDNTGFIQS